MIQTNAVAQVVCGGMNGQNVSS